MKKGEAQDELSRDGVKREIPIPFLGEVVSYVCAPGGESGAGESGAGRGESWQVSLGWQRAGRKVRLRCVWRSGKVESSTYPGAEGKPYESWK